MGDQRFQRKKYSTPRHPWEATRIAEEREMVQRYGLKNKRELWKSLAILDSFRTQARQLEGKIRYQEENAVVQFKNMIRRLNRLNVLQEGATLDDVLSLQIENILDRRLQTIVFRKKLALTMKQARQFITHGQISVGGRRTTLPGMLVPASLESTIEYDLTSPLMDELHPMRQMIATVGEKHAPREEEVEEEVEVEDGETEEEKPQEKETKPTENKKRSPERAPRRTPPPNKGGKK